MIGKAHRRAGVQTRKRVSMIGNEQRRDRAQGSQFSRFTDNKHINLKKHLKEFK